MSTTQVHHAADTNLDTYMYDILKTSGRFLGTSSGRDFYELVNSWSLTI